MGLRYGLALACGYLLYLLLVRLWAGCMLRRDWDTGDAIRCPRLQWQIGRCRRCGL
jgi:hypothetical protein